MLLLLNFQECTANKAALDLTMVFIVANCIRVNVYDAKHVSRLILFEALLFGLMIDVNIILIMKYCHLSGYSY